MGLLPAHKATFLLNNQERLQDRVFLIDTMTQVGSRPVLILYSSEMITETKRTVEIDLMQVPTDAQFIPYDRIWDTPPEEQLTAFDRWVLMEQSEMVRPSANVYELIYRWRNYLAMDADKKAASDAMCKEIFGRTNQEFFEYYMSPEFNRKRRDRYRIQKGDVFMVTAPGLSQGCLVYVSGWDATHLVIQLTYLDSGLTRVLGETDTFNLKAGDIQNFTGNSEIVTTVGRFLLNKLLIQQPFGDYISYQNDMFNLGKIEEQIATGLIKGNLEVSQYKRYVDNLFFIGHFTELCVPTYSRKSLSTDPEVARVKAELMEKYAGRLNDPLVIAEIESTLINMDKTYLKDDAVMRFYAPLGDKPFNISRKKMYLTIGGVEAFSKTSGDFTFIGNSLSEGMTTENMPAIADETRKGSYNRGDQTKLGGTLTKRITKVLQDLVITIPDCQTNEGLDVDFNRFSPKRYLNSYVWLKGGWVLLTEELIPEVTGKVIKMRSPMYCQAEHGLCQRCMGEIYKTLDSEHVALYAVDITSTFTTDALKSMHGTKLALFEITDLNQFVLN